MLTINQVLTSLHDFERETTEVDVAPTDLELLDSGEFRLGSENLQLTSEAESGLARLIQCPVSFFSSISGDLQAVLTNGLLREENRVRFEKSRVTINNNAITGFSNAHLVHLAGSEVLETALGAMPGDIDSALDVHRFNITHDTLSFDVSNRKTSMEVRVGDVVSAGISVLHAPNGRFATKISTYLHRLVCTNGMTVPVCRHDKRLRVRRLDGSRYSKTELQKNLHMISEIAWSEVRAKLQAFATLANQKVDVSVVLDELARRMRLSRVVSKALRQALHEDELGFDPTQMGVINAMTRLSSHHPDLSETLRCRLMEAAGVLSQEHVHRCPKCFSVVYKATMN